VKKHISRKGAKLAKKKIVFFASFAPTFSSHSLREISSSSEAH
jgi:hypothetical protein